MMIDLLIFTHPWDIHALVVASAAEELGAHTKFIQSIDFPNIAKSSIAITGASGLEFSFRANHENKFIERGEVVRNVWVRRIPDVTVDPRLSAEDRKFARTESMIYVKSTLHMLKSMGARLLNDPSSSELAEIKPLQLQVARDCGLSVPDTLVSNSPEDVRRFVKGFGPCIVKSARPFQWGPSSDKANRSNYTALVDEQLLEQDDLVATAPQIFQKRVSGKEIRALVIGEVVLSALVNSNADVDARLDRGRVHSLDESLLADAERQSILSLCKHFGLEMGSIDLIRADGGDLYFLEVNEQGQWMFLAQQNESVPVVEMMTRFLLGDPVRVIKRPNPNLNVRRLTEKLMRRTEYVNAFNKSVQHEENQVT